MATQKQIAANRLNSKKATGPRTPRGKAISSRNAWKTGEYSKSPVVAEEVELQVLTAEYNDRFAPATLEERFLVSRLVRSEWLSRRFMRLEAAIWNANEVTDGAGDNSLGAIYCRASKDLDQVGRGLDSAQRNFHTALTRLLAIRARRAPAQAPAGGTGLFLVPKRS